MPEGAQHWAFRDRSKAERSLAEALQARQFEDPVVVGLRHGSVPVALVVADALDAPLDVLAPDRAGPFPIEGRSAVVVDDGLASGETLRAALRAVRARRPRRVVLALPTGVEETTASLGAEADEVVVGTGSESGVAYLDMGEASGAEVHELLGEPSSVHREAAIASPEPGARMAGDLVVPEHATGLVVFAHCSGSSRFNPRNRRAAAILHRSRLATLLLDLLTPQEELDRQAGRDIPRAADRLLAAAAWAGKQPELGALPIGYFGAGLGAGVSLWAAAEAGDRISAIVSRGGRPDLAAPRLADVRASVLLIAGGRDDQVVDLNRQALLQLRSRAQLSIFPRATQRFDQAGTLEEVVRLAAEWFRRYLTPGR
jgi:putative phosphoribosyl transferase